MYLASEIDDKELLKNVVLDTYNNLKKIIYLMMLHAFNNNLCKVSS